MQDLNEKLWQEFLTGDKRSLALIFKAFYEKLYQYGVKLTGSESITEDSLQELFFKLWKNRDRLKKVDNLQAYLFISYRHTVYDNLRWFNNGSFVNKSMDEVLFVEFSHEDFLIREQVDATIRERLLAALNSLTSRQREAIFLRYFEQLDFESISGIMGVNVQSVRNFIHRGILALRELYIKEPGQV